MANETSYPLAWPHGWPRAKHHEDAKFRHYRESVTIDVAMHRLMDELERIGADHEVLSTNYPVRIGGGLRLMDKVTDTGAAVYFTLKGKRVVLACDKWFRVQDNIVAISKHIEALRGQERWGVGSLEQAFRGYRALEDFTSGMPWRRVLGFKDEDVVTRDMVESRYRQRAREVHPDTLNGPTGHIQMAQLNTAIVDARKELTGKENANG